MTTDNLVLVVDDDPDAAKSLTQLLGLMGHKAAFTTDPTQVPSLARDKRPSMVFLDIGMPGVDGWELARLIRKDPGMEGVRLVAITGHGEPADRQRSREAGFDAHIVKPIDMQLLDCILKEFGV